MSEYTHAQLIGYLMVSGVTGYTLGQTLRWVRDFMAGVTRD